MVEGPARRTLERECPRPGWTLCSQLSAMPRTVEEFQFGDQSTINRAGGYKAVAAQAWPIILSTVKAEPGPVLFGGAARAIHQFGSFATGDWLLKPNLDVKSAWEAVFPRAEVARYLAAKQQRMVPLVSDGLQALHRTVGFLSLPILAFGAVRELRRRTALGGLLTAIAIALLTNAVVSGGVSGVYDRYQSRFVWLAVLGAMLTLATLRKRETARPASPGQAETYS